MDFNKKIPKIIKITVIALLVLWFSFFLMEKINLTTADLGRHIKNGEIILENFSTEILKTNYYSYTHADYPFINHHWGSGVVFYLIFQLAGFGGLSFFYILLSALTFFIFFDVAQKASNTTTATLVSLLLIPLMANRGEVRPEVFSYFFLAIFLWILWNHKEDTASSKWLIALPFVGLIWVNVHIYFFFAPFIVFLFLFKQFFSAREDKFEKIKELIATSIFTITAFMFNPIGFNIILYPLNIFKNYGYKIIENQSVWFLENLGTTSNLNFNLFKISFILLILSFVISFVFNKKKFSITLFSLSVIFSIMAWLAIRNFSIFAFFALPTISYNIRNFTPKKTKAFSTFFDIFFALLILIVSVSGIFQTYQKIKNAGPRLGVGLMPEVNKSIEFFKQEKISGPIFNNYDIGGFLIFHLFDKERVYVDNRPEAYPEEFFTEEYIPMQQNTEIWKEKNKEYGFNTIFFSHRDATPWGQQFLVEKIQDENWAPVFADSYSIIFLKRNTTNEEIIKKYEIPKENFGVIKN